jgi:hypothetical protein
VRLPTADAGNATISAGASPRRRDGGSGQGTGSSEGRLETRLRTLARKRETGVFRAGGTYSAVEVRYRLVGSLRPCSWGGELETGTLEVSILRTGRGRPVTVFAGGGVTSAATEVRASGVEYRRIATRRLAG